MPEERVDREPARRVNLPLGASRLVPKRGLPGVGWRGTGADDVNIGPDLNGIHMDGVCRGA